MLLTCVFTVLTETKSSDAMSAFDIIVGRNRSTSRSRVESGSSSYDGRTRETLQRPDVRRQGAGAAAALDPPQELRREPAMRGGLAQVLGEQLADAGTGGQERSPDPLGLGARQRGLQLGQRALVVAGRSERERAEDLALDGDDRIGGVDRHVQRGKRAAGVARGEREPSADGLQAR